VRRHSSAKPYTEKRKPYCNGYRHRGDYGVANPNALPRDSRATYSFRLQTSDKLNQVLADWFFFDREKGTHKSDALTGPQE